MGAMSDRPNLLVLISDQHSPHVMGCAKDDVVRTPHLDRLAEEGVRFDSCYCPAPLCVPSRMSFLTGRFPSDNRVWTNHCVLNSNIPTFAHSLAANGMETLLCGRMHFRGPDQRHGFTKRMVGEVGGSFPGGPGVNLGSIPVASTGQCRAAVETSGPGKTSYQAFDEDVASACCDFLSKRRPEDPAFAMVVGFVLPHCPYVCPKPLFEEYMDKVTLPDSGTGRPIQEHPAITDWRRRREILDLPLETVRRARAGYYGLVTHLDGLLGRILATLREAGLDERTVVMYMSDHGEMAGEHAMWWKSNFYEASAKVPLIARGRGVHARGATIHRVVSLLDVAPTLLDLTGTAPLPFFRGQSLRGFLETGRNDLPGWADLAFCEHASPSSRGDPVSRMVRKGPWKLNHYHGYGNPQLFHLERDPGELEDLGRDPDLSKVHEELLGLLFHGWTPSQISEAVKRVEDDRETLVSWGKTVQPADPDHWIPPESVIG